MLIALPTRVRTPFFQTPPGNPFPFQLSGLSFCHSPKGEDSLNITGLARAAVSGDEKALDLLSSCRVPPNAGAPENLNAYAGSANGVIYYLNENGSCTEVLQADGAVKTLLMWNDVLIVITEHMVIGQFQSERDGAVRELSRVKLSTRLKENHVSWVGAGQLAISSGEMNIRLWDLKNDDNYVLSYEARDQGRKGGTNEIYCKFVGQSTEQWPFSFSGFWKPFPNRLEDIFE